MTNESITETENDGMDDEDIDACKCWDCKHYRGITLHQESGFWCMKLELAVWDEAYTMYGIYSVDESGCFEPKAVKTEGAQ